MAQKLTPQNVTVSFSMAPITWAALFPNKAGVDVAPSLGNLVKMTKQLVNEISGLQWLCAGNMYADVHRMTDFVKWLVKKINLQ